MRLAVMQPYLFPYIGYFKLIAATNKFVFYDDVNFIKNGWINRNRLELSGSIKYFTIPLVKQSSFKKILDTETAPHTVWRDGIRESIRHSYKKSPFFRQAIEIFDEATASSNIAEVAKNSVKLSASYIGLECDFIDSSTVYGNATLTGQERILDICARESAKTYINAPGGRELYDLTEFAKRGIALEFLDPNLPTYSRGTGCEISGLSILDLLMYHSSSDIKIMING